MNAICEGKEVIRDGPKHPNGRLSLCALVLALVLALAMANMPALVETLSALPMKDAKLKSKRRWLYPQRPR